MSPVNYLAPVFVLALSGCATPRPQPILVPTPLPCEAAQQPLPDEPARTLALDPTNPAIVQTYASNRRLWMGYADALKTRLVACKS